MKKVSIWLLFVIFVFWGCKVSYKFNGASIDYNVTRTIEIRDFQNQATRVYAPLAQAFNERMNDVFIRNTKLTTTRLNPDMEIEGEIIRYDFTPQAVSEDAFASQTRLTMAVRFRFRNNKTGEEKEETISAYRDFNSDLLLDAVQDDLIKELNDEIVDQIFNATLSNW